VKERRQNVGGSERAKAPERNEMRTINELNGMNNDRKNNECE